MLLLALLIKRQHPWNGRRPFYPGSKIGFVARPGYGDGLGCTADRMNGGAVALAGHRVPLHVYRSNGAGRPHLYARPPRQISRAEGSRPLPATRQVRTLGDLYLGVL